MLAMILARKVDLLPPVATMAQGVAAGAVDAVDGVLSGTVIGLGTLVGIPATNKTQCQKDIANGDMWEASFSCPAKDFLSAAWDRF